MLIRVLVMGLHRVLEIEWSWYLSSHWINKVVYFGSGTLRYRRLFSSCIIICWRIGLCRLVATCLIGVGNIRFCVFNFGFGCRKCASLWRRKITRSWQAIRFCVGFFRFRILDIFHPNCSSLKILPIIFILKSAHGSFLHQFMRLTPALSGARGSASSSCVPFCPRATAAADC
jgi:hypothetical protein